MQILSQGKVTIHLTFLYLIDDVFMMVNRKELLLAASSGSGVSYDEHRYLRRLFRGCIFYRRPKDVKSEDLSPKQRLMISYRSRFLKFLWVLWFDVIPNIKRHEPREFLGISTDKKNNELFYSMATLVSECINHNIFCSLNDVQVTFDGRPAQKLSVPNTYSELLQNTYDYFHSFLFLSNHCLFVRQQFALP